MCLKKIPYLCKNKSSMILTIRGFSLDKLDPSTKITDIDKWPNLHRLDLGLFDIIGEPIKMISMYRQGVEAPLTPEYANYNSGTNTILEIISVFKELTEKSNVIVMYNSFYNIGLIGAELVRLNMELEKKPKYDVREKNNQEPFYYLTILELLKKYNIHEDAPRNEMDLLCKLFLAKKDKGLIPSETLLNFYK